MEAGQVRVEACPGLPTVPGTRGGDISSPFEAQKKSTTGRDGKKPPRGLQYPKGPFLSSMLLRLVEGWMLSI